MPSAAMMGLISSTCFDEAAAARVGLCEPLATPEKATSCDTAA